MNQVVFFFFCPVPLFVFYVRAPTHFTPSSAVVSGKKRAWIPDPKEAYIEIEIKERSGDKVTVETKDGRVSSHSLYLNDHYTPLRRSPSSRLPESVTVDSDSEGRGHPADESSKV